MENQSQLKQQKTRRDVYGGGTAATLLTWDACRNTCWTLWQSTCFVFLFPVLYLEFYDASTTTTTKKQKFWSHSSDRRNIDLKKKSMTSLHDQDNGKKKPTERNNHLGFFSVLILFSWSFLGFGGFFCSLTVVVTRSRRSAFDGTHHIVELHLQNAPNPTKQGLAGGWTEGIFKKNFFCTLRSSCAGLGSAQAKHFGESQHDESQLNCDMMDFCFSFWSGRRALMDFSSPLYEVLKPFSFMDYPLLHLHLLYSVSPSFVL